MSHTRWGAERTVGIHINGENVRVIEIAEMAKPYDDFSTIGYAFSAEHAATIVKAVNSYKAMKEALEGLMNTLKALDEDYDVRHSYVQAEKALTLSNGKDHEP